jgi:hypothetical protein
MSARRFALAVLVALAVAVPAVAFAQWSPTLGATKPHDARFRLLSEDGLATPEGKGYVAGVKIWTMQDRTTGTCTVLMFTPSGIATASIMACPTDPQGGAR